MVPVKNCLQYTKRLIASLSVADRETLLIIDNASTDGTREYLATQPYWVLPQIRNLGVAASWNLGIFHALEAGAEHVIVLNNDLVLAQDTLQTLIRWTAWIDLPTVRPVPRLTIPKAARAVPPGALCGFVITPALVDRVGWFDERYFPAYGEDLDYLMRLRRLGLLAGSCYDALAQHYPSRTICEGGVSLGKRFKIHEQLFRTTWGMDFEQARQFLGNALEYAPRGTVCQS